MRRFRKTIVITLVALAFTLFFTLIALDPYYYSTRPREPHPESGRIYRERVKGGAGVADVYLTRIEKPPYDYSNWILNSVHGTILRGRLAKPAMESYQRSERGIAQEAFVTWHARGLTPMRGAKCGKMVGQFIWFG